jgi:hypothetical protein
MALEGELYGEDEGPGAGGRAVQINHQTMESKTLVARHKGTHDGRSHDDCWCSSDGNAQGSHRRE